jgi:DsbC/DsbD-like thiol-disulfide interchange protein
MKTLRGAAFAIAAAGAICAAFVTCASARADQSAWVEGFNNKVRLIGIAAPPEGSKAAYMAGVEIEMSPGFKTYWRSPGEAGGVPPEFDWSGSGNLASARVLYPAPHRLIDKAGANIGYKDRVIFPVEITPTDPAKPVTLHLQATYGVCKNICIPAEAELELGLSGQTESSAELTAALEDVPKRLMQPRPSCPLGVSKIVAAAVFWCLRSPAPEKTAMSFSFPMKGSIYRCSAR